MRVINLLTYSLLALAAAVVFCPLPLNGQSQSLNLRKQPVKAVAEQGTPERGRFQFIYSYSGDAIGATLTLTNNGTVVARQSGLAPVSADTLADITVARGDVLVATQQFGDSRNSLVLAPGLYGYPDGVWAGSGRGAFYQVDQDGNIIYVYGNWQFSMSLTPPWNGITVEAQPAELVPGESATISLQPYETPAEEVMIPDETWINVQTSLVGDLLGGLGLPAFGLRYFQGFARVPWGLLKGTDMVYEVLPDSLLGFDFDPLQVPVVAYSPFDTGINGSAVIEVTKEEDLDITLALLGPDNAWPTLERGDVQARFNLSQVDNVVEDIMVSVTKSTGEPAPNQPVQIEAVWVTGSGGHSHTNVPPKDQMGVLSVSLAPPLLPKKGQGIVTAQTDGDGKIYLNYVTPKFGGKIDLTATLQTATGQSDTKQMIARVPGLIPLPNSVYYDKIGGTNAHHGPPSFTSEDDNHWGTSSFISALTQVSREWNQSAEIGLIEFDQIPLHINDISLPNGGLFDIEGGWTPSHDYHRVGRDADIRTTRTLKINGGRVGVYLIPITVGKRKEYRNLIFERIWLRNGAYPEPKPHFPNTINEHYHVYFY